MSLRALVPGEAIGEVLRLIEPLSFWGGIDPATGEIVDVHHPQLGASVAGQILVMPEGRGSSSSSSVLAEAIRAGVAPAAIVLSRTDPIVALGSIVARELYGFAIPVVIGEVPDGRVRIRASRDEVSVEPDEWRAGERG